MNFEHLLLSVEKDIVNNNVPMLVGEAGIGKSSWVESLALRLNTKCFCLPCNQLADKADLTGCRLVKTGTTTDGEDDYAQKFFPHIVIKRAIEYAENNPDETPILFLDEINRTTPDVTSEALSIPTMRSIGDRDIPDNLKVIIAGNDKGNVVALDKASTTRFVLYHIEPDMETFIKVNPDLNRFVESVLMKNPDFIMQNSISIPSISDDNAEEDMEELFEPDYEEGMVQMTVPRTITAVSKWLNEFKEQELVSMLNTTTSNDSSLLQDALVAHCGETPFTIALLSEIVDTLTNNGTVQIQNISVNEPPKYKDMLKCVSRDDVNDFIDTLTDDEKSEIMVYLLYDKRDNRNYIECLAPAITALNSKDTNNLSMLGTNHMLDEDNFDVLCKTNCVLSQLVKMMGL